MMVHVKWRDTVKSAIPRGFCRYFILSLLKTKPYTGKEIIDYAIDNSDGMWHPSSGLVYPLLSRLIDEKLIRQTINGTHKLTKKGIKSSDGIREINDIISIQIDVLFKLSAGAYTATHMIDKISSLGHILGSNYTHLTRRESKRYEKFLRSELNRIQVKKGL